MRSCADEEMSVPLLGNENFPLHIFLKRRISSLVRLWNGVIPTKSSYTIIPNDHKSALLSCPKDN